jgi:hypothetical protein
MHRPAAPHRRRHVIVLGTVQHTCDRDGQSLAFLNGRFGDYTDRGHEPINWFF